MESSSMAGLSRATVLAVVAVVVLALIAALSAFTSIAQRARESEAKNNLRAIQVALEKYGTDHLGHYPLYLIGGEARCARRMDPDASAGQGFFADIAECPDLARISDPLLREGYLTAYPRNPFVTSGRSVHQAQLELPAWPSPGDPLRNFGGYAHPQPDWWSNDQERWLAERQGAFPEGRQLGTRFGARCDLMGQVLADPRFPTFEAYVAAAGKSEAVPSYANVEYQFWDVWGSFTKPYLPGEFFYKGTGMMPIEAAKLSETQPVAPAATVTYVLGLYGSLRAKGEDSLGDELPVVVPWDRSAYSQPGAARQPDILIWPWTRSANYHLNLGGSPYSRWEEVDHVVKPVNANGIKDGVIMLLSYDGGE